MFEWKKTSRMIRVILAVLACLLALVLVACGGKDEKKEVTVTFYVDGAVYHTITNSEITLPQDPTKDGYTFAGWYLDDGVFAQAFSGSTEIDVSVYAKWTQNTPAHEHDWGAWGVTTQPTCTQKGVETRTCLGCGATETHEIAALDHDWGAWVETTAPTFEEKGEETRTCSRCGATETREVAVLEHIWSAWVVTTQPTCENKGEETRTCSHCDAVETREVAALDHSWSEWRTTVEASCEHTGLEVRACSRCNKTESREIAMADHNTVWVDLVPATRMNSGVAGHSHCNVCGKDFDALRNEVTAESLIIPKLSVSVSFFAYEGTGVNRDIKVYYGEPIADLEDPAPTRSGYVFAGYYYNADTMIFDADLKAVPDVWRYDVSSAMLYAHWDPEGIPVHFNDSITGASLFELDNVVYGEPMPTIEPPTMPGYVFIGFFDAMSGGKKYYKADGTAACESDLTALTVLYAQWSDEVYFVSFNANGGEGEMQHIQIELGHSAILPLNNFTRTGYTFGGWSTAPEGVFGTFFANGATVVDLAYEKGETVELYARWNPKTYKIVFNHQGGEGGMESINIRYNELYQYLNSHPTKTGYNLVGYYDDPEGGSKYFEANGTPTRNWDIDVTGESFTLYARWEAKTVTLYFTTAGGADITYPTESVIATYGEPMPTIEIPTRPGHEFLGYFLDSINYEQYYKADGTSAKIWDYVGNESALIYAHWDLGVYTVTLDVNGGNELPEVERTHRVMYTYNFTFAVPTRTGYTFLGWFDENDVQYTYNTGNHCIYVMSDVTLYAHWQAKVTEVTLETGADSFTVTFDMNGMPGEAPAPQKVTGSKGLTYVLPPVVEGYFFTGWCDASGNEFSFADRVTSDTTLYASWSAVPTEYADYTILNSNSENVIEVTPEFKYYAVYVVSGGMLYINVDKNAFICDQNAVYGAEGYRSFSVSTGEILYFRIRSANMSTDPEFTGDATLYIASALPAEGGLLATRTFVDATYDETVSLGTPACAGYYFDGWYTEDDIRVTGPDGIVKWNLTGKTILLNARWLAKTTITFDLGTGTGTVMPSTVTATYTKDLPAIEVAIEAANPNYEFVGFFSAADGGKQYYDAKGNSTSKWDLEGSEAVFYAHYRGKKIVASFNGNGNTGGRTDNQVFYYDEEEALVANGYTKYGYDFIGWNTRVDGTGKSYTDGEVVSNLTVGDGNIILYAQWEAHRVEVTAIDYTKYYDVTVTFDLNGAPGETPAPQTVTATEGVTYPIPEIWEGHVFCGWYDNAACTGSARNMSRAFSESVTLYAKWEATTYIVLNSNETYNITITEEPVWYVVYNYVYGSVSIALNNAFRIDSPTANYMNMTSNFTMPNIIVTPVVFSVRANGYTGEATLCITAGTPAEGGVSISNIVERKVISYGEEFTITPASSENYDFYGYSETKGSNVLYVDESGNGLKPFEVTDVTRKNLYAVMRGKKSVITYDYCDDQHEDEVFDAYYGESLPHPTGVTSRNGYSFKGFFTEPDGAGTKVLNESVNVVTGNWLGTEDTTFYAYWEARTYQVTLNDIPKTTCTVTFHLNEGTSGLPDPQEVGGEVALVYPDTIPFREGGYRFRGWSLSSSSNGAIYDFTQPLTNNIVLYAQWYYSAHPLYQGDNTVNVKSWKETYGFTSLITGDVTITVGKNAHLIFENGDTIIEGDGSITIPCKAGYWYNYLTIISYEGLNDEEYTGTTTLTISSDLPADGGTFTGTLPTVKMITFGSDDYKLDVPEAEEGKVFVGWFFRDKQYTDGEGNAIIAWDEAQNFTLYAHFEDAE